MAEGLGVEPR